MGRKRVTISIKDDLLEKIDDQVDGIRIRNRSHAVESLAMEALGLDRVSDAIIMAGGEDALKSLEAIKNSLVRLKALGIKEVIVAIGFLGDKIKNELRDGGKFGVNITYHETEEGSGGVLYELKKALKNTFIVVNLDKKMDIDYKILNDFHKKTPSIATVATDDIKSMKGIYVMEPEVLKYIPKGFSLLEEDVFPKLLKENKLTIYPVIK